ncbi:hypothetical protein HK096_000232, partial [Nowakowskiella sp. JEL0078]
MSVSQQEKPKKLSAHKQWIQKKEAKSSSWNRFQPDGTGIDNKLLRYLNLPVVDESHKRKIICQHKQKVCHVKRCSAWVTSARNQLKEQSIEKCMSLKYWIKAQSLDSEWENLEDELEYSDSV